MKYIGLFTALFAALALHAQPAEPKSDTAPAAQSSFQTRLNEQVRSARGQPEAQTFEIEFPGGKPAALVQELARHSGVRPNVIVPSHLENVRVPKFALQGVNVGQVFRALNMVADENGGPRMQWISQGSPDDPRTVWTLAMEPKRVSPEACQVWFIGSLLQSVKLEDVNTAINAAWEMLDPKSSPALKFHKESNLLIARGTEQQLKLVQDVITAMGSGATFKKESEAKKAQ